MPRGAVKVSFTEAPASGVIVSGTTPEPQIAIYILMVLNTSHNNPIRRQIWLKFIGLSGIPGGDPRPHASCLPQDERRRRKNCSLR